ncbi:hypothetical protein MTO96_003037 [Rhipicephalus appendiculatus]
MDICDDVSAKTTTPTILQGFVLSEEREILQENVYVILGDGKFQRQVLHCSVFSVIVLLLHAFAYRVIGRPVDHWCRKPDNLRDFTVQEWKNVAIPVLADGSYSKCAVYDPPIPDGNQEERRTVPCNQWDYDIKHKEDDVISRWDLVCQYSWLYSLSSSIYMLGPMLLAPLAGFVSDRLGRRPTMMASAITMLFSCLGAGSSQSFGVFLVARFMVSAAASATNLIVFVVLYEVTGSDRRALYGLLATCVGPTVTPTLLRAMSLLHPSWKVSQVMLATATALVVAWCYCVDESPVWLLAVGNVKQAELTILQGARYNGVDLGKARATFKAFRKQLERLEMAASAEPAGNGGPNSTEGVLRVVKMRRQAASVLLSWFAVSLAYYGTAFRSLYMEEQWELTGLLLKALLFVAVLDSITRRGQRVTLSGLLLLLCASSAVKTAFVVSDVSVAVPLLRIVVEGSAAASMCVTCLYTTEVFPTITRGTGLSVSYSVGRVGVILATWLTYVAHHGVPLWLNSVTTVVVFVSALAVQWLPEILVQKERNKGEYTPPKPAVEEPREEDTKVTVTQERGSVKNEGGVGSPIRSSPSKPSTPPANVVTQLSPKSTPSRGSPRERRAASTPGCRSTPPNKPAVEEQREADTMATLTQERGFVKNEGGGGSPKQSSPSMSQPSAPRAEVVTQPSPKPTPSMGSPHQARAASTPKRLSAPPKPAVEEQREEATEVTLTQERGSVKNEGSVGSPIRPSPSKSSAPPAEVVTQPFPKAMSARGSQHQERAGSTPRFRSTPPKPALEEQRETDTKVTLTRERESVKNEVGGGSPKQSSPSMSQPSAPGAEVVTQSSPKATQSPSGRSPQRQRGTSTPSRRQRTSTNGGKSPKRRKARSVSPLPSKQAKS